MPTRIEARQVDPEIWLDRHVSSTLMFAEGGWHDATGQAGVRLGSPLSTNGVKEAINLAGGVAARYTLLLAPLVLVQGVTSTTALFVFAFGVALS